MGLIRTAYLTPYKILLLVLIRVMCCYALPPHAMILLSSYLLEATLNNEQCEEPSFCRVVETLISEVDIDMETVSGNEDSVVMVMREQASLSIIHMVLANSLQYAYDMNKALRGVSMEKNHCHESTLTSIVHCVHQEYMPLNKESPFGVYIRRCLVAFEYYGFEQVSELFAMLQSYISPNAHNQSLELLVEKDLLQKEKWVKHTDPKGLVHSNASIERETALEWLCDDLVINFLRKEQEKITTIGKGDYSPKVLSNYIYFLQRHTPEIKEVEQLHALNSAQAKECKSSLQAFNQSANVNLCLTESQQDSYAMIQLGIFHARLDQWKEAKQSFKSALLLAHKAGDRFGFNEAQGWLYSIEEFNFHANDTLQLFAENEEGENIFNVSYHRNLYDLVWIQRALLHGKGSTCVFERLFKSFVRETVNDVQCLNTLQNLTASSLWRHYGVGTLADNYLNLALHTRQNSIQTIENIRNTCIYAAETFLAKGEDQKANELLSQFQTEYPEQSFRMKEWKQIKSRLGSYTDPSHASSLIDFEAILSGLTFHSTSIYHSEGENPYQHAIQMYKDENLEQCRIVLEQIYRDLKNKDLPLHLVVNFLARAQLKLDIDATSSAIDLLRKALDLSKKCHSAQLYYTSAIKLAEALVQQDPSNTEEALFICHQLSPKVAALGSELLKEKVARLHQQLSKKNAHVV
ncbi:hypothetical protein BDF14DRAFT_1884477 [Spinellus fusiger]|nr:hypothetical protein BDF14DRAFT_1884477 [Spinellus fusiger]